MTFYVDDELSDVDHPSPLSTSEVFGTIVVLFLGVVSMLSQQKDSSSRDFPPPKNCLTECMAVEKRYW